MVVEDAKSLTEVADAALKTGKTFSAFVFHGHGVPGQFTWYDGNNQQRVLGVDSTSDAVSYNNEKAALGKIASCLSPDAEITFVSCFTGQGVNGLRFLNFMSLTFNRTVSAPTNLVELKHWTPFGIERLPRSVSYTETEPCEWAKVRVVR